MARKKKHEEHENHERWLVSYADFITLLFAFFTVLYATSQTDQQKLEAVIDSLNAAFQGGMPRALLDVLSTGADESLVLPSYLSEENASAQVTSPSWNLEGSLSNHLVQIGLVEQTLTLALPEKLLFAPGSAELHPSAYATLGEVAKAISGTDADVRVIGFADGVPVASGSPYQDNWGLASARAASTVRYLQGRGVPAEGLSAVGRVVPSQSPEARAVVIELHLESPTLAGQIAEDLWPKLTNE